MNETNIPQIRFKGYTDTWEQRELGMIAKITMGQSPSSVNYTDNSSDHILVQGNADMKNGQIIPRVWTTQVTKIANENDLIMSVRAPVGEVGKTAYNLVIGRGVASIKGGEFLFQTLKMMNENGYWKQFSAGSTFDSINSDALLKANVRITNDNEQTKIGDFFKTIDNLITCHQRKCDKLIDMKKSLLGKMFPTEGSDKPLVRFSGFTNTWEQRELGEISEFSKGKGYSKSDLTEMGIPIILYGRLYTKYETTISKVDTFVLNASSSIYSRGIEVVIPASGETPEDIARASAVEKSGIIIGGDLNIVYPNQKLNSTFLALTLSDGSARRILSRKAQGKSVVHLRNDDLRVVEILYPGVFEQTKIGEFFKTLDNLITCHQRELEKLQNTKKSLLEKMFV